MWLLFCSLTGLPIVAIHALIGSEFSSERGGDNSGNDTGRMGKTMTLEAIFSCPDVSFFELSSPPIQAGEREIFFNPAGILGYSFASRGGVGIVWPTFVGIGEDSHFSIDQSIDNQASHGCWRR